MKKMIFLSYPMTITGINFNNLDENKIFICSNWEKVKIIFRTLKDQRKTLKEFKPLYIQFIKNITNYSIITLKRIRLKGVQKRFYSYNEHIINFHMELNEFQKNDKTTT